jgi:hypothetical protein
MQRGRCEQQQPSVNSLGAEATHYRDQPFLRLGVWKFPREKATADFPKKELNQPRFNAQITIVIRIS